VVDQAVVPVDGNQSLQHLIAKLLADMHMLFGSLSERTEKVRSGESNTVSQFLNKKVYSELSSVRRDIDDRLESFLGSFQTDILGRISMQMCEVSLQE
jgi:hypothetical protein